jgi:hypothetical protein
MPQITLTGLQRFRLAQVLAPKWKDYDDALMARRFTKHIELPKEEQDRIHRQAGDKEWIDKIAFDALVMSTKYDACFELETGFALKLMARFKEFEEPGIFPADLDWYDPLKEQVEAISKLK